MRLIIDENVCQGHLRCHDHFPDLFDVDDIGHGVVKVPDVPQELLNDAEDAVQTCPERAIRLEE